MQENGYDIQEFRVSALIYVYPLFDNAEYNS